MTKILLQNDRLIFDGHADSIQECETITLLCDSLANNPNFKTVRYESGYAEFEKIGKAEELMFAPELGEVTINWDSHIISCNTTISSTTYNWTESGESNVVTYNKPYAYTINVVLDSGYILDTISWVSDSSEVSGSTENSVTLSSNGSIAGTLTLTSKAVSSQKSYDLSTSSKWSALSDGEHTVQIVAKGTGYRDSAKSTSVTVTKGGSTGETWVLNESIASALAQTTVNFKAKNSTTNYTGIRFAQALDSYNGYYYYDGGYWLAYETAWHNQDDRTITFDSPVTDTDLLAWLQANGTKQGGATQYKLTFEVANNINYNVTDESGTVLYSGVGADNVLHEVTSSTAVIKFVKTGGNRVFSDWQPTDKDENCTKTVSSDYKTVTVTCTNTTATTYIETMIS